MIDRTLDQRRAEDALKCIRKLELEKKYGNYASYAKALPASILTNGLGQALAFEKMKADTDAGHKALYEHVSKWLCRDGGPLKGRDAIEAITQVGRDSYMRAHAEAIAYLEWLKKFAVTFLEKGEATP